MATAAGYPPVGFKPSPPYVPSISGGAATFRFVLAWSVVLILLGLANRTRLGHVIIYYLLALSLLFLLVTQYQWLANVLQPAAFSLPTPPPTTNTASSTPAVAAVG